MKRGANIDKERARTAGLERTREQRVEALRKATAARCARSDVKKAIKSGDVTIAEAMEDPVMARCRVRELLEAVPNVGKTRSAAALESMGIPEFRRVRGLGAKKRAAIAAWVDGGCRLSVSREKEVA